MPDHKHHGGKYYREYCGGQLGEFVHCLPHRRYVFARHRTIVDALSPNVTLLNLHFTTAIIPGEEPDSARRHRLMDGECFTRLSDKHGQPLCINAACKHPKMEPTGSGRVGCLELLPAQARHQSVHEGRASISRLHQKDTVLILPRCAAAVALCCHHFR